MAWQAQPGLATNPWERTANSEYGAWFGVRHRPPGRAPPRKLGMLPNNQTFDASALDVSYRAHNAASMRPRTATSYANEHLPPLDSRTAEHDTVSLPGTIKLDASAYSRKPRSAPQGRQFPSYSGMPALGESNWMFSPGSRGFLGASKDTFSSQKPDKPSSSAFSINDTLVTNSTNIGSSSHTNGNGSPRAKLAQESHLNRRSTKGSSQLNLAPKVNKFLSEMRGSDSVKDQLSCLSIPTISLKDDSIRQKLNLQNDTAADLAEHYMSYRKADPLNRYSVNLTLNSTENKLRELDRSTPAQSAEYTFNNNEEENEAIYTLNGSGSIKTAFATIRPHSLTGVAFTTSPSPRTTPRTAVLNLSRKPAKSILRKTGLPGKSSNVLSPDSIPSYPFVYNKSNFSHEHMHNVTTVPTGIRLKPTKRVTFNI